MPPWWIIHCKRHLFISFFPKYWQSEMRSVSQERRSPGEMKGHGIVPLLKHAGVLLWIYQMENRCFLQTSGYVKSRCTIFSRFRRSCTSPDDVWCGLDATMANVLFLVLKHGLVFWCTFVCSVRLYQRWLTYWCQSSSRQRSLILCHSTCWWEFSLRARCEVSLKDSLRFWQPQKQKCRKPTRCS